MSDTVGIIGAGTMGAGIAQVAAVGGWTVHLHDADAAVTTHAIASAVGRIHRLVEKGRLTKDAGAAARARLHEAPSIDAFAPCALVIEAVVEDLDVKVKVLGAAKDVVADDAILATNTSSLSVTDLGRALDAAPRTVGMHFFNPAPLLKLVEVVAGVETDRATAERVAAVAESWGKVVARAADVPGFIVNHVARPYYLEAFRILEDGYAKADEIDEAMRRLGRFRMGPLELTDLIGQDVNTATTRSVWERLDKPPLLEPSALQVGLVAKDFLGRKTERGVYDYSVDPPTPALDVQRHKIPDDERLRAATDAFVAAATKETGTDVERHVFARILAALITQAELARRRGVASATDIDVALKYGVNYPRGPFEWRESIGIDTVQAMLDALDATVGSGRFALALGQPT